MRHVQQNKAKIEAFNSLSETTALWIRDYCQKVLPMKFRESQSSYFGKKGMTLHADVFLMRENGTVRKQTYFTAAYRCDQDVKDTLSIADYVLKKFTNDFPRVNELFGKCDNASCYHGNPYPELLYQIAKANELTLKRLDYNEPQKGKDQCDRDAALARNALRKYVEEGNDIINASDIVSALTQSSIKDACVAEVEFDNTSCIIQGDSLPKIHSLHSFEFSEKGFKAWRYFGIGSGEFFHYSSKWKFVSNVQEKQPFTKCFYPSFKTNVTKKLVPRKDRNLCTEVFCTEKSCIETFETFEQLRQHLLNGMHRIPKANTSYDHVKMSFANRLLTSSSSHAIQTSTPSRDNRYSNGDQLHDFSDQGWALPKRSNFRFNQVQKNFLFQLFSDGEITGKKHSPEEVHLSMRGALSTDQYCSVKQIRSLYSRWSREVKSTSLEKLKDKVFKSKKFNFLYI